MSPIEAVSRILFAPEPFETHRQFTDRMIETSDRLLSGDQEPLNPIAILYKKSDDLSLPFEGYLTLMRAARYLHDQEAWHGINKVIDYTVRELAARKKYLDSASSFLQH